MGPTRQPISTFVGVIWGRDAVFLDRMTQTDHADFMFEGDFNGNLCQGYTGKLEEIPYQITFHNILAYQCCAIDHYPELPEYQSSFDVVLQSAWAQQLQAGPTYQHYVFSTYDYIYDLLAERYTLDLGDAETSRRPKP